MLRAAGPEKFFIFFIVISWMMAMKLFLSEFNVLSFDGSIADVAVLVMF